MTLLRVRVRWQSARKSANSSVPRAAWPQSGRTLQPVLETGATEEVDSTARCRVVMDPATSDAVAAAAVAKGDVLAAARIAAVQSAKRTTDLLPASFRSDPSAVEVTFEVGEGWIDVSVRVVDLGRQAQMEAMTACTVAGLTIYDMCKAMDRAMAITDVVMSGPA